MDNEKGFIKSWLKRDPKLQAEVNGILLKITSDPDQY